MNTIKADMDDVPDEVLVKMLRFCCTPRRIAFRHTSRRMSRLFDDRSLWKSLEMHPSQSTRKSLPPRIFDRILELCGPFVHNLLINGAHGSNLTMMARACRNIKHVKLIGIDQKYLQRVSWKNNGDALFAKVPTFF
ncbi:hypothetical protein BC829DRAFT_383448, partial [Chytridium lagenaria]